MTWYFPFICLGIGALLGLIKLTNKVVKIIDYIGNIALLILMLAIGINVGTDDVVIANIGIIGYQCVVISLLAMFSSIFFVFLLEKTILPLDKIKKKLSVDNMGMDEGLKIETDKKRSPLVWIIPLCIIAGILFGYFIINQEHLFVVDKFFIVSLIVLYITVGIGLTQNRGVFKYIKNLGVKIIFLPIAIIIGSMVGGLIAGLIFDIPPHISIISASGMSYYSITGAFMTQTYGIHIGSYGFLVNVFRDFFTVLLLPLIIRIGKGAPIAAGASSNMDTMLVPVTKFVGIELGFIALIIGTILTFTVPFLLPILTQIF